MLLWRDLFTHPLQLLPPGGGRGASTLSETIDVDADMRAYTRSFSMPMVVFAVLSTLITLAACLAELT